MSTLGDEYPKEQERCRGLLVQYKALGPIGQFGYVAISEVLRRADVAAISGDLVEMIRCFQEMKGCE